MTKDKIDERHAQINWTRERLESAALQYARLKCFGSYLGENGNIIIPCLSDSERLQKNAEENMRFEAVNLLRLLEGELPERSC